jgi:hypothetical protein
VSVALDGGLELTEIGGKTNTFRAGTHSAKIALTAGQWRLAARGKTRASYVLVEPAWA